MSNRRNLLFGAAAAAIGGWYVWRAPAQADAELKFEIVKTDDEWRKILSKEQYRVLRKQGTERAFTHPFNDNKAAGIYHCGACELSLYNSKTKFDSGTGWPSFFAPLENAVGTSKDYFIGFARTEVHCRRCGGHLGHIFDDGPAPTGKRHCINGVSIKFVAA